MHQYTVPLSQKVPLRLAGELSKRVFFVSEDIESFELVEEKEGETAVVCAVRVTTRAPSDTVQMRSMLNQLVSDDILPQRSVMEHRIWQSSHPVTTHDDTFDRMLDQGIAIPSGEGQLGFGDPFTGLVAHLDEVFRAAAQRSFGALEHRYPSLIPTGVLARSGYLTSFPQFLMFAGRLHGELDSYKGFVKQVSDRDSAEDTDAAVSRALADHSTHSGYTLSPAVCYHVYEQHAGKSLDADLVSVTARGTCFRHESRYHRSLERLWEFTMREVVFIGSENRVAEARNSFMQDVFAIVEELGLAGHVETASDPFFCDAKTAEKIWTQRLMQLKYELLLPVPGGRSVAAVSFNTHGSSLGEAFSIRTPDREIAHTGCVAFGLERFAYAFVCQHGLDPAGWPDAVSRSVQSSGATEASR
ncbi:aminoacyl--tRNA ligase-related protein [Streptomyces cellostaticus]|uniref:aminoacyl--tRNA ligase-related protein n=1 Tax=Streptomyces cellostaticus TaxID=67285 RepID=UPI002025D805|nr:aminoacyl--tRNA ligase-related protein [Streptomyces cellostaticus]